MRLIVMIGWIALASSFVLGFFWADGSNDPTRYLALSLLSINGAFWVVHKDAKKGVDDHE